MTNTKRQHRIRRVLWTWWIGVMTFVLLLWFTAPVRADDPEGASSSVMYQVTYKDKSIRNLSEPPTTNKGILMVTRITRTNSSLPSMQTVSTGNQSVEMLNPGRTQETQLTWDGQTWVPAVKMKKKQKPSQPALPPPPPSPAGRPSDPRPDANGRKEANPSRRGVSKETMDAIEIRRDVQHVMELLSVADRSIRQAELQVGMAGTTPSAVEDAKRSLAEAREAQQEVMSTLIQLKRELGIRNVPVPRQPVAVGASPPPQAYDPNRPIVPPATLHSSVAAGGNFGYGWTGACAWPYFGGNVMVQSEQPNPDFDVGPRAIIREQK